MQIYGVLYLNPPKMVRGIFFFFWMIILGLPGSIFYIPNTRFTIIFSSLKILLRQFGLPIKALQIDNGAEFKVLTSFLSTHGISHRLSYPYIPEQNGRVERKIYHIIETGLTFFNNAYMPLKYWSFSFQTTILLINIIHIPILSHLYPYQILFHKIPLYSSFKVFGCLCFPNLRPYMKNKLLSRSFPCVFLGYSSSSRGYLCLHADTRRAYTSRHVRFVESVFPFFFSLPSHVPPSSSSSSTPTLVFPFTQSFLPSSHSSLFNVPSSQSSSPPPVSLLNGSISTIPPIILVP